MFTNDMNATDVLNSLLTKLIETSEEKGREVQRALDKEHKLWEKSDELSTLKARLAKYEQVPGYPAPIPAALLTMDDKARTALANKIGEACGNAARGEKIHAIKLIREASGVGLKEAKDAFEIGIPPAPFAAPRW